MKKLLLLASLTLLTLSCSTDETTQRDENCYNSEVAYPQISLLPTWQGEFIDTLMEWKYYQDL